jgi:hypothetical protein
MRVCFKQEEGKEENTVTPSPPLKHRPSELIGALSPPGYGQVPWVGKPRVGIPKRG